MTDVLGAVFDFLQARLSPAPAHIVRGWGNRSALPKKNDFVVLTLIGAARRGTNVRQWKMPANQAPGLDLNLAMLTVYDVQADFCGQDEERVSRMASQFVILGRDAVAVDFFRPYGLSALHADDPRALPFTNDQNQWQTRYSVMLHLAGWADVDVNVDAFDKVHITLENVDVHHPVTDRS